MEEVAELAETERVERLRRMEKLRAYYETVADFESAGRISGQAARMMRNSYAWEQAARLYAEGGGFYEVAEDWSGAAALYHHAGDLYHRLDRIELARSFYHDAALMYLKCEESVQAIVCYEEAADACRAKHELATSGQYLAKAAELLSTLGPSKSVAALHRYLESALDYANSGREVDSMASYRAFSQGIDNSTHNIGYFEFGVNRLMATLEENGLEDFAGRVYVDKMRRKRRKALTTVKNSWHASPCANDIIRHVRYLIGSWLFDKTMCYGESGLRWVLCTLGLIFFFSILYFPNPWGYGYIELNMVNGFEYPASEHLLKNFVRSFSFSVTVFSTLGFGNVSPANSFAEIVVIGEVLLGYLSLGVLVALITRRLVINRIYR